MASAFYKTSEYRKKQSVITKRNQVLGIYEHLKKDIIRACFRDECDVMFSTKPHSPKRFCSRSCSAIVNNTKRTLSENARQKIALSMAGRSSPYKGVIKVPRVTGVCSYLSCSKVFVYEQYKKRMFCSVACAMKVTGGQVTSPKASRGKAGIRKDIDETIYFYSRWEANVARLYNYLGVVWEYAPRSFDIGGQRYTPDFYLPKSNMYIEVKNFWGEYSRIRDAKFRKTHPTTRLKVLLKEEYLGLEQKYAHLITEWEYSNRKS